MAAPSFGVMLFTHRFPGQSPAGVGRVGPGR
ncbi:hypothetical protein Ae406Ps2_0022 [Pseudonocardia sp. Ae406_Ps2]|nr:hypothetical protein Ae406Ps2_0022 [Pseudonocardia sp. Ae406_Ps2]OLM08186.1 hypothetical protein Ae331Ps2_5896c [Pseudonocardia sp. Ae331_Ps2]OLM13581.1 hypothetical protein Ae505Ps2_3709 [Pseudonocardia sp. Ae505_Ps2]OLM21590.1 hypothetical protein Ae706Ps2_0022 [Pseudonocardia sp. Ae706_Ps2]